MPTATVSAKTATIFIPRTMPVRAAKAAIMTIALAKSVFNGEDAMHHNTDEISDLRLGLLMLSFVAFIAFGWAVIISAVSVPL